MLNLDRLIIEGDRALRSITGVVEQRRATPKPPFVMDKDAQSNPLDFTTLTEEEKKHSAGLMRVNHVGEICAQALYQAQSLTSKSQQIKIRLAQAATEEEDHLAWCSERLNALGSRPSLLNPLWFAGAFAMGTIAGLAGDRWSLGFVAETEKQVEFHLNHHLNELPVADMESRVIVEQMRNEEIEHGQMAKKLGAKELPDPLKKLMASVSKVMTKTAYFL